MDRSRGDESAQLRALLRLVIDHQRVTGAGDTSLNPSGEQAADGSAPPADRMHALAAFVAEPAAGEAFEAVDLLALRLLLDEYAAAVNRERGVAIATAQALDRVRGTIRAVTGVQRDFKIYPDATEA
jgi:hypothetical protein